MRRFCIVAACAILTALSALLFVEKSSAQTASVEDVAIRKAVDGWLDTHRLDVAMAESAYYNTNRQYWQGISTHPAPADYTGKLDTSKPISDADVLAATLAAPDLKVPTDQPSSDTWFALFPSVVNKLPVTITIDIYDSPSGPGYTFSLSYCVQNVCSSRTENVGPEQWRSEGWQTIKLEAVAK